jgi:SAM-dependent methyltransferase
MNSIFEDKDYWISYYKKLLKSNKNPIPSAFAVFLVESGFINKGRIIELGCGNGRDSIYFSKQNTDVTAIDQCSITTELLNIFKGISYNSSDFTNLNNVNESDKFDYIYSRFTLHSVDEDGENRTLNWAFKNLNSDGLFCIEVRTTKDILCGKGVDMGNNVWFYNNHHRRFVEANEFKLKLKKIGFEIDLFTEDNGFAKYKDEDPIVLRVIARKP